MGLPRHRCDACAGCLNQRGLFPGSDVNVPILTEQNPAEMVGESVFDCRPPGLPVSIPLSGLSPAMISGARDCTSHQQLEESSRSIMNMDTNEISISRIVGFAWNDSGTDVEDELPSPVASPGPIMSPTLAPADSNDPFGRGVNFDLDLENVFCDAAVLPSLVTPLEDTEATVARDSGYLRSPRGARRDVLTSAGLRCRGKLPTVVAGAP